VAFISEAYRHLKTIGLASEVVQLFLREAMSPYLILRFIAEKVLGPPKSCQSAPRLRTDSRKSVVRNHVHAKQHRAGLRRAA
jgi:hypothetical protein